MPRSGQGIRRTVPTIGPITDSRRMRRSVLLLLLLLLHMVCRLRRNVRSVAAARRVLLLLLLVRLRMSHLRLANGEILLLLLLLLLLHLLLLHLLLKILLLLLLLLLRRHGWDTHARGGNHGWRCSDGRGRGPLQRRQSRRRSGRGLHGSGTGRLGVIVRRLSCCCGYSSGRRFGRNTRMMGRWSSSL
jgi:hypothetical protein